MLKLIKSQINFIIHDFGCGLTILYMCLTICKLKIESIVVNYVYTRGKSLTNIIFRITQLIYF